MARIYGVFAVNKKPLKWQYQLIGLKENILDVFCKEEGNALYKSKKFTEALAAYDEAIAIDPTSMTFLSYDPIHLYPWAPSFTES